ERATVGGGDEDASAGDGGGAVDPAVDAARPPHPAVARVERPEPTGVVAEVENVAVEHDAAGDLRADGAHPTEPPVLQVEREDPPVPGSEVVDAVAHDRRRLDRRPDAVVPAHASRRAVEHPDRAAHVVVDEFVPPDGR